MSQNYGLCPKCLKCKPLTRHHILPKRFFNVPSSIPILHLCRKCHDKIERLIPYHRKLNREDYIEIARNFLRRR